MDGQLAIFNPACVSKLDCSVEDLLVGMNFTIYCWKCTLKIRDARTGGQ